MAEFDQPLWAIPDGLGGVCGLTAVCESTQTKVNPEGGTSPLVVRIKVFNSTAKSGRGTWQHSNGQVQTQAVLPGENHEVTIAPNRRLALHELPHGLSWGP